MEGAQRTFLAGFNEEGDAGGVRFFCVAIAPTRPTGVGGPRLLVLRYLVPQALHSMGLDAGPLLHCGESVKVERRQGKGKSRPYVSER